MDGITFDQLQSVFGNVESELKLTSSLLENIQGLLGQKLKPFDEPLKKLDQILLYLKQLKEPIDVREIDKQKNTNKEIKQDTDESVKKGNTIFDIEAITASKVISGSAKVMPVRVVDDPKVHTQVDIFIPPATRVFIENILGDNIKRLTEFISHETDRLLVALGKKEEKKEEKTPWWKKLLAGLKGVGGLFGKLLSGLLKPFEWLAGKLFKLLPTVLKDIGKLVMPIVRGLLGAVGPLLAGAGLAIAGIATLLSGLKDSGPYKGLKKLLGRGLLGVGTNILKKEFGKLSKLAINSAKELSKESRKFVFSAMRGLKGVFKYIAEAPGKLFGGIAKALKNLFTGGVVKEVGEVAAKGAGKGGFKAILGNIGKFLSEKVLKRLPFIGTLIGLGFAFTRLMKGDVIGALLDVASALATSVPVVGTALSIAIDVFSAVRDTQTGGSEKAGAANMSCIGPIKKWIGDRIKYVPVIGPLIDMVKAFGDGKWLDGLGYLAKAAIPPLGIIIDLLDNKETIGNTLAPAIDFVGGITKWLLKRIKYVPVIGPLIDMVNSISDGKWLDALGYLAKAAIPPLGILIDMLDNTETIANTAASAGNWIADATSWIYNKVKEIPVIGSLIKAGEAIASGKWGDVLGYLGEAIEPLQYIGKLIESGAKNIAQAVTTGDFSNINTFFTTIKDSLISAVLNMLPESILGVSVRSRVAKMLGVAGYGEPTDKKTSPTDTTATTDSKTSKTQGSGWHWQNPFSKKTEEASDTNTTNAPQAVTNNNTIPQATTIQPTDQTFIPDTDNDEDNTADSMSDMNNSLDEHSNLLKGLIEYQKQTATNTKELIQAFIKYQSNGSNVNVNNISSSTTVNSNPVTSSAFRQAILQR